MTILPGGSTNVVARTLGIPNDVVDATEHLLGIADRFEPRKIDLGIANGRKFVFSCGSGLDATAAMRVDMRPKLKARAGPYFYTWVAISSFYREYLRNPVRMRLEVGERSVEGVTVLAQNSDPFTYFGRRPVRVCEGIEIDDGTLSVAILRRAAQRDMGPIISRVLAERLRASRHRQIEHFDDVTEARVESVSVDPRRRAARLPGPGRRRLHRHPHRARARHRPRRADGRCLSDCAFCAIAAGEADAEIVFEDDVSLAFLDFRPLFPGHSLLIPRAHHETLGDLPDELVEPLFSNARLLSVAVRDAMGAQGSFVAINNVVSQSVPHLHVHVVPRVRKDGLRGFFWPRRKYEDADEAADGRDARRVGAAQAVQPRCG